MNLSNNTLNIKNNYISIAKGIGIILMVAGHCRFPYLLDFIYMFHMPLFFFISGWCFKIKYLSEFHNFCIRRIKGTYIPFLKWGLLFILLHNIFYHLNIYNDQFGYAGQVSHLYSLNEHIKHAIIGCGLFLYPEELLGGYWFLVQLFWGSLIGFLSIKFIKNPYISASILLVISFIIKLYINKTIPFTGIGSITFLSASFFVYGFAFRNNHFKFSPLIIISCFLMVLTGSFFWNTTMQTYTHFNVLPYAVTGVFGSIMIIEIAKLFDNRSNDNNRVKVFLIFAGENSLTILTWHFLSFKLVSLLIINIEGYPTEMLAMFPVIENAPLPYTILYLIIGVALPLFGLLFLKRTYSWIPILRTGQQKR